MGVKSVVKGPNDSSHARGAFINLPVSCDGFSPSKAILVADEVVITRVPNTRRDVDAELRGNVHLRYTVFTTSSALPKRRMSTRCQFGVVSN